ncbi:hypothetical protein JTE90_024306 [Oedothorax gibbosus]|uniref:Galactokinase n=1 Tax=Oedothorax gibbosus TaxID=931172 RepID=A0AAV6VZ72_9ARAC|nr:hypothetical protein JTE90_024306 [Oedothorax gibbosus]
MMLNIFNYRQTELTVKMEPPTMLISDENEAKFNEIGKFFESSFGTRPSFYARVPGRVNLIGEHIDYCGFFVLPMAIEQDIIMAVKTNNTNNINLVNFDFETYKSFSTTVDNLSIDTSAPQWHHYFLCGYRGIAENYELDHKGLDVVVKGTIPPSSGLSSSSAMVCASALATAYANRISMTKMEIAALCAVSERYIGTQGGGMDQAIGFLAESGAAKLIEFNPLKATNVPLPDSVVFIVSNSCVAMNKAATSQFNTRVIECKLAAKVLAKKFGFAWQDVEKLAEIPILLGKDVSDMKALVKKTLPQKTYSKSDLCSILNITAKEFPSILSKNTQHLEHFQLSDRATHVFDEAKRVRDFKLACEEQLIDVQKLGKLMNESHASCRDLYDCSHPVLNELVETAIGAGAVGSRLTGAGWGGCCVSMVLKSDVEKFMSLVKKEFYDGRVEDIDVNSAMFLSKPMVSAQKTMAPWAFMRVNYVPMTLGVVFSLGLATCFVVAVLRGDVSPYMPFISETGGKFPEAGIFSIFLYLSVTVGLSTMFVRYVIVAELNRGIDRAMDILNRISLVIGFIALMGMVVVAAYPMTSIPAAHNVGANVLFLGAVIYAILQTWLSFKMEPYYNGKAICYIRLVITILSAAAFITLLVIAPIAMRTWGSAKHDHWTGNKVPKDKGFDWMVASATAEWIMAILFLAYYFTFIREFGKVCIHLRVQLLVQHFDEEPIDPNLSIATERTPIVM